MSFMRFESLEQMTEWMAERTIEANAGLAPDQLQISYGQHWARFDQVGTLGCVIFGRVATLAEAIEDTPADELDYERASITENHDRGYMFGRAYSIIEPDGEWGDTHRANMWPVAEEVFVAAREAGWDHDEIAIEQRLMLAVAHAEWVRHVKGTAR